MKAIPSLVWRQKYHQLKNTKAELTLGPILETGRVLSVDRVVLMVLECDGSTLSQLVSIMPAM